MGKDIDLIVTFFVYVAAVLFVYYVSRFWWRCRQKHGFLIFFTRELIMTVESNLPLVPSLKVLAETFRKKYFKRVMEDVSKGIEEGNSLAESLSRKRGIFPAMYVKMLAMGEESGSLARALRGLLHHLRTKERFQYELQAGLTYPCALILLSLSILLFLVTFIMPTFAEGFSNMGAPLPKLTVFLISFSYWFKSSFFWIVLVILAIFGLAIASVFANRDSASFNRKLMRFPFFGTLMRNIALVRFCRNLAMFLKSSFPLPQALETISQVPLSKAFQHGALSMQRGVEEGEELSDTMRKTGIFPSTALWLASMGEDRGNLEEAFEQIADFYAIGVEGALRKINILSIPIATLLVGGCIGCIVVGLFSALVAMTETLL
jgi:type IV pilus assembly protein PilC